MNAGHASIHQGIDCLEKELESMRGTHMCSFLLDRQIVLPSSAIFPAHEPAA